MPMKIGLVIAARTTSRRLPSKATLPLSQMPILEFLFKRVISAKLANVTILATSNDETDDQLQQMADDAGVQVYRGSLNDVLNRYAEACEAFELDVVVRLTGDNPFVDGIYVDHCLSQAVADPQSIWTTRPHCPDGLNVEIVPAEALIWLNSQTFVAAHDREHVTSYFYSNHTKWEVKKLAVPFVERVGRLSLTIDTVEDYRKACRLVRQMGNDAHLASMSEFIQIAKDF